MYLLNQNNKTNSDINFFVIITGISQGHTLVPYMFIICLNCVL